MSEFGIKEFMLVTTKKLEELKEDNSNLEIVLENPKADSKFPEIVAKSPLKYVEKVGILFRFSITIEAWAKKKYACYELADKIDKKLSEYNFVKTSTPIDLLDEITNCYRYGGSYEVLYNALNNTFEKIKN